MPQRIEIAQSEIGRYANRAKRGKTTVDRNRLIEMFGRKMFSIKGRSTDKRAWKTILWHIFPSNPIHDPRLLLKIVATPCRMHDIRRRQ